MAPAFGLEDDQKTILQEETIMTKLGFLGVAAVAATAALATPAFAQQKAGSVSDVYAQRDTCGSREPGNPYDKQTEYWDWSAWRTRGGWDSRNDSRCVRTR
jgi:hypothetical protein